MIKLKGGKIKKVAAGSASSKSVKLDEVKKVDEAKEKKALIVQSTDPGLKGLAFEATLPDGSKQKGKIDGSGRIALQVDPSGESKLAFPGLEQEVKGSR